MTATVKLHPHVSISERTLNEQRQRGGEKDETIVGKRQTERQALIVRRERDG